MDAPTTVVKGDLLSCYTSAISGYLQNNGIPYPSMLGTQLFLAVKAEPKDKLSLSFLHYHTSLRQSLVRRTSDSAEEALLRMEQELRSRGSIIVAGDTKRLPWTLAFGHRHTPHWFLIDRWKEAEQSFHISDAFEFTDDQGTQPPFSGWVSRAELLTMVGVSPYLSDAFLARDQQAFGDVEPLERIRFDGYQWFESEAEPDAPTSRINSIYNRLSDSADYMSGRKVRTDLPSPEWKCGLEAMHFLLSCFEKNGSDPGLYEHANDFWVTGRTRVLFADTLRQIGEQWEIGELQSLSRWCDEHLLPAWYSLPRVMHYNDVLVQKGRAPRDLQVSLFQSLCQMEEELLAKLEEALPVIQEAAREEVMR